MPWELGFIGRKKEKNAFWELYEKMESEKSAFPQVIYFYGPKAVGKTELLEEIKKEVWERCGNKYYAGFNFKDDIIQKGNNSTKRDFLYILSRQMILCRDGEQVFDRKDGKISLKDGFGRIQKKWNRETVFPVFDTALVKLERMAGKEAEHSDLADPAFKIALRIFGAVQNSDFEGAYQSICALFDKHASKVDKQNRELDATLYNKIGESDDRRLNKELETYFIHDAKKYLEKTDKPFVIMLDQLDALSIEETERAEVLLLELIQNLPGVLWVFTGEKKLKWEQKILQYPLGRYSESDIEETITDSPFKDEADQNNIRRIYEITKGIPFYFKECVDSYSRKMALNKNGAREDLQVCIDISTKNYLNSLNALFPTQRTIMQLLSCFTKTVGGWTDDELRTAMEDLVQTGGLDGYDGSMIELDLLSTLFPIEKTRMLQNAANCKQSFNGSLPSKLRIQIKTD